MATSAGSLPVCLMPTTVPLPPLAEPASTAQDQLLTRGLALASGPELLSYDHYVISLSGGKDSQACLDVLAELFSEAGVLDRVTTVHAAMGRSDWPGTVELAREHAEHYGLRHELVARTGCDLLDRVAERGKWPDKDMRWCTVDCTI